MTALLNAVQDATGRNYTGDYLSAKSGDRKCKTEELKKERRGSTVDATLVPLFTRLSPGASNTTFYLIPSVRATFHLLVIKILVFLIVPVPFSLICPYPRRITYHHFTHSPVDFYHPILPQLWFP
jgi:hypothetical protein